MHLYKTSKREIIPNFWRRRYVSATIFLLCMLNGLVGNGLCFVSRDGRAEEHANVSEWSRAMMLCKDGRSNDKAANKLIWTAEEFCVISTKMLIVER